MKELSPLATQLRGIFNDLLPDGYVMYFAPCPLHEGVGGSARLGNMLSMLRDLRLHVYLASYAPSDRFGLSMEHPLPYDYLRVGVKRTSWLRSLAPIPMLAYGALKSWRCTFVFAHAPSIISGMPAFLISCLYRKPLIIDHMDLKDPQTPQWLHDYLLRKADKVFCISHWLEDEVKAIGNSRVVYVPPFVDCE